MSSKVLFESSPLLFSQLIDGRLEKHWKSWAMRIIQIRDDGTLMYRNDKKTENIKRVLSMKKINIVAVPVDFAAMGLEKPPNFEEVGIHLDCLEDGFYTAIKCVISLKDLNLMLAALRDVSYEHNIDDYLKSANLKFESSDVESSKELKLVRTMSSVKRADKQHSVMRRSIAHVVDVQNLRTRNERIIARRGAFKWLPVAFTNDLVHGSWWYVYLHI